MRLWLFSLLLLFAALPAAAGGLRLDTKTFLVSGGELKPLPEKVPVGSTLLYRVEVENPFNYPVGDVVVELKLPPLTVPVAESFTGKPYCSRDGLDYKPCTRLSPESVRFVRWVVRVLKPGESAQLDCAVKVSGKGPQQSAPLSAGASEGR
ncbi:hypothetical protein [Thermovibrio ammonificans]